jgi:hypothetical protein
MRRIGGARALNALNSGAGMAGVTNHVTVYVDGDINSPRARAKLARAVDEQIMQSLRLQSRAS